MAGNFAPAAEHLGSRKIILFLLFSCIWINIARNSAPARHQASVGPDQARLGLAWTSLDPGSHVPSGGWRPIFFFRRAASMTPRQSYRKAHYKAKGSMTQAKLEHTRARENSCGHQTDWRMLLKKPNLSEMLQSLTGTRHVNL